MTSRTADGPLVSGRSDTAAADDAPPPPEDRGRFAPHCLSLDLEVGREDGRIHAFAALRPDTGGRLVFRGGNLGAALAKLDALAGGAVFVLGHNLIRFDLPHLGAARPDLRLLSLPAVDTLWLNPLAFPRNPYHHLVKHYQDGQLKRGRLNDPELDAGLTLRLFNDQCRAFRDTPPELLAAWHWLTSSTTEGAGFDRFFSALRRSRRPSDEEARRAIEARLEGSACLTHAREVVSDAAGAGWALAYALAWLSVAGGNSVMPPWVRHQFPEAGRLVRRLRDTRCEDGSCRWCRERHDAKRELARWFGYPAFRREPACEDVAEFLQAKEVAADFFHSRLPPETKKEVQRRFIDGELRVIAATNAFGMGIDKPDVRLVIHADIPGSLENYLQEAGRAGRDRKTARCVLLYTPDDVESQFGMSARTRLTRREIHGVLRALRNLDRKKRLGGEVVATAGEILGEDDEKVFERDSATDDTRVRTAIAWLEEAVLLTREENRVQVFPSSLRVGSVDEARERLERRPIADAWRRQLLAIAETLIDADPDEGISTDELMGISGLNAEGVRSALYDLERLGIASNDTALTAFVHSGVERSSRRRFEEAEALETALIAYLREAAPDLGKGDTSVLHLRVAAQALRDQGVAEPLPERLWRILRSIAADGWGEGGGAGSLGLRKRDAETVHVTLQREWNALEETAARRRAGARRVLEHLLSCLPAGTRGVDLLAETTLGNLLRALTSDLVLKSRVRKPERLLDRALLWLHEQEVIRLHKGLAVFRPAMTIRLAQEKPRRGFASADFEPLRLHYRGQVLQIHVMVEFARRGLEAMADALRLAMDYFSHEQKDFLRRWLPARDREIARETTPESWRAIVESLKNPVQQRIVADDREQTNVLVLAGPGSGKTRVLVHRIAYLVRARRESSRGILALAYNRHAAVEIRRRLAELIGNDARGVTVLTCHALAMRLVGASFSARANGSADAAFQEVLRDTTALLRGEGLLPEEADEQRERLLAGFRWILVDEYQDVDADQYALISALAGRTQEDEDSKLTLFAVGDDDQNIYAFNGASVEFIRRFEADYGPKPAFLTANYRSTGHIVEAANALIAPARERMKTGHPIHVDRARAKEPPGGAWRELDPVARGRVQILPAGPDPLSQAQAVVTELERLAALSSDWDWSRCAAISREWKYLEPVRALCECRRIPAQLGNEEIPGFWRLREVRAFVERLRGLDPPLVDGATLRAWADKWSSGPWIELLHEALDEHELETGGAEVPVAHFMEWLAEWGREARRRQHGLLLLSAHRAKGLQFDHVAVLDGGWERLDAEEDPDAPRRLYYVAMTRARQTLALAQLETAPSRPSRVRSSFVHEAAPPPYATRRHPLLDAIGEFDSVVRRPADGISTPAPELGRRYRRPALNEINLGFAGRRRARDPVHRAIAALAPGDPLNVRVLDGGRLELLDSSGAVIGRLAKGFRPPPATRCVAATVRAIVAWSREESEPQYRDRIKCDVWEVVVPELVFEPGG